MNRFKRLKSDLALSTAVAWLLLIYPMLGIIVNIVDMGIFYANHNMVANAAQEGANMVAILGGSNPSNRIAVNYGLASMNCPQSFANNAIECDVTQRMLRSNAGITGNVSIQNVTCSPGTTTAIGQPVQCVVNWRYYGVSFGFLDIIQNLSGGLTTRGTSATTVITN